MRYSPAFFLLTALFFVLFGSLSASRFHPKQDKGHYSRYYHQGDLLRILISRKVSESPNRTRYEGRLVSVDGRLTRGRIFVTLRQSQGSRQPEFGDTLVTRKPLKIIAPPANPGSFDFRKYASRKNIIHQLSLMEGEFLNVVGRKTGLKGIAYRINRELQLELGKALKDAGALALAKALLLGYRHELSSDLLEGYKQAGAMHILAISGLHVGIILFALLRITRSMSRHRTGKGIQLLLVVFGLWGYALITGMSVSAVRAVSMFSLLTLGRSMNRDTGLMRNLVTSAMILLMIDPLLVFDVGFQLSYSALAGIGLFTPLLKRSREKFSPAGNYILQILVVSCAAQLGVLPLSLLYFKQFSGVFLISSLALLPVLGFTLAWGYAIVLFSIFAQHPAIVGSYYEQWLQWINITVGTIGSADALILKNVYYPMSFCLLTYLLISLLYLGIRKNKIALVYLFGLLLLIMQLEWLRERRQFLDTEELIVFHLWKESLIVKRQGNRLCTLKPSSVAEYRDRVLKEYGSLFPGRILTPGNCEDERRPAGFAAVGSDLVMVLDDTLGRAVASNPWKLPNPEVLVLVNSPRINLERLLGRLMPEKVVADGSNYPSFAKRWRETCKLRGIAFHDTSVEGAFMYRPRI